MKKIIEMLLSFVRKEFHLGIFLSTTMVLAIGIYWRYGAQLDTFFRNDPDRLWKGFLLFALPYFTTILSISSFKKDFSWYRSLRFWGLSLAILLVLWANQFLLIYENYLPLIPSEIRSFLSKVAYNLFTAFTYGITPLLFYLITRKNKSNYGLTTQGFDDRSYLLMLGLMLPLLVWASFQTSFIEMYPRYVPSTAERYWDIPNWLSVGVYESSYVLQFILLELFFRGFMVMELKKYFQGLAVLPMTVVYAYIHFGKPFPETLGSIFGGFILGILALRSGSILGGIFLHIGIALLMELLAYLQRFIFI